MGKTGKKKSCGSPQTSIFKVNPGNCFIESLSTQNPPKLGPRSPSQWRGIPTNVYLGIFLTFSIWTNFQSPGFRGLCPLFTSWSLGSGPHLIPTLCVGGWLWCCPSWGNRQFTSWTTWMTSFCKEEGWLHTWCRTSEKQCKFSRSFVGFPTSRGCVSNCFITWNTLGWSWT